MTTIAFDLRDPAIVADEIDRANRRLAREPEVPRSILELVRDLAGQIGETDASELEAVDPYLWIELQRAAIRALGAAQEDAPDVQRRRVRIALEQIRFLLARLAEQHEVAEDRPVSEVARWFDQALSSVSQRRKSSLAGVGERTYQRWIRADNPTRPSADDERRLRVLARVTRQLRHSLTGPGVVDWLEHPRRELGRRSPVELLQDPAATEQLLTLAAETRSHVAA